MDNYKETFETWNKVALLYQDKFMGLDLYNETYDFVCDSIKENSLVLEIGCGPGNITKYVLSKRPDLKIHGTDVSTNMIELARINNPSVDFSLMDCREIKQLRTKYDVIVSGFCLPYLSDPDCEQFIFDSYNLLNENGLLYISFVEGDMNNSGFKASSTGDRCYFYYHESEKLKDLLVKNEFEIIKIFKINYKKSETEKEVHIILIAKKLQTNHFL